MVVVVKGADRVEVGGWFLRVLPCACVREEARWSEAEEVEKKEEAVALLRVCNVAQRNGLKYCKSILLDVFSVVDLVVEVGTCSDAGAIGCFCFVEGN